MESIPEYGDLISIEEFVDMCKRGSFIDYDGFGNYAMVDGMSTKKVYPSDIIGRKIDYTYTHVVWFNR
jgi:hypothetical protein